MFALVDCDQFFVSCERVFRPDLWKKPVAVLSNNDGCIIARSPEVKALGIKMGEPWFKCKQRLQQHQVTVFSSNFSLYADLSQRVITCIKSFIESDHRPRVEVYSIDEAFIDLRDLALKDLYHLAQDLRLQIWRHTGIPVSIGVGSSKTLAKVATHFAKRSNDRVRVIQNENHRFYALHHLPIHEVWGIGTKWSQSLKRLGIDSALDLAEASLERIQCASRHSYLQRTAKELRGESCQLMNFEPPPRSSIQYSRTFAKRLYTFKDLLEIIEFFASELGRRLRSHQRRAGTLVLSLSAQRFDQRPKQYQHSDDQELFKAENTYFLGKPMYHSRSQASKYSFKLAQSLDQYTDDSSSLIKASRQLLQLAFFKAYDITVDPKKLKTQNSNAYIEKLLATTHPNIPWRKAGLLAVDLRDHSQQELCIFQADPHKQKLSQLEDQLNQRFGRGTARVGGLPHKPKSWQELHSTKHSRKRSNQNYDHLVLSRKEHLSPRYTTCWADLPVVL